MARPDPGALGRPAPPIAVTPAPAPVARVTATLSSDRAPSCKGERGDECQGVSCCTRLEVPAGSYTSSRGGKIAVAGFWLDEFEVTVGRVRTWNGAGGPTPAAGDFIGRTRDGHDIAWDAKWPVQHDDQLRGWARYDTWSRDNPVAPKNFVSWYTAAAFCHAEGGRLPTDDEWRYAAVGGEENRHYPWGSEPETPERAVYDCLGDGNPSCSAADILSVGSKPLGKGRWGHMDLAGSMFEWTADAPGDDADRGDRGGGFCYIGGIDRRVPQKSVSELRRPDQPETVSHMVGFRCAYDSKPSEPAVAAR